MYTSQFSDHDELVMDCGVFRQPRDDDLREEQQAVDDGQGANDNVNLPILSIRTVHYNSNYTSDKVKDGSVCGKEPILN